MARRVGTVLAGIVRGVVYFIVAVLAVFVVLNLLGANPENSFAKVVAQLAGVFDLGLSDLFMRFEPWVNVLLNYGLAIVLWLLIGAVVTRLLGRL